MTSSRPHLLEGALGGLLLRPPAQELGAVAEAAAGEVVVAHLADQRGPQGLPFRGAPLGPAAGAARRLAGETWRLPQGQENGLELRSEPIFPSFLLPGWAQRKPPTTQSAVRIRLTLTMALRSPER